jgi:hypothetical protein
MFQNTIKVSRELCCKKNPLKMMTNLGNHTRGVMACILVTDKLKTIKLVFVASLLSMQH